MTNSPSLRPPAPFVLRYLERTLFIAAAAWIAFAWVRAGATGSLWLGVDDILRMRHVQYLREGTLPIEWGGEWLPGVMVYQAAIVKLFPFTLPNDVLVSGLIAYLAAYFFARRTALLLGGVWGAMITGAGFALSPIGLRLSASAHGEPVYLAAMLGGLWFLTSARHGGSRWRYILAIVLFACAETIRMEAWVAVLPCLLALALRERETRKRHLIAFLILALIPFAWLSCAFVLHGNPFHNYMAVAKIHEGYYEGTTALDRLMRVFRYFASSPTLPLQLAIAGMTAALYAGDRTSLPAIAISLSSFVFLFFTAISGTFSPLPLDRFVAVPVLLTLPLAGCFLALLDGRATSWLKPLLLVATIASACAEYRAHQFDEKDIREKMRLNLIDAVRETNGMRAFPNKKARNVYAMPALPAELAINTMHLFYEKDEHQFAWTPSDTSAVDLVKKAQEMRAQRLFVDPRDYRAIRDLHDWYYHVHTLKEEPPVPGWEPVRFVDGVFLVIRTKPY